MSDSEAPCMCPACGSTASEEGWSDPLPTGFTKHVRICRECRLGYTFPLPTMEDLRRIYKALEYFAQASPTGIGYTEYLGDPPLFREVVAALRKRRVKGRLLEVGCANGDFLAAARDAGFAAEGIEVNEAGVVGARARGLEVHHGFFEEVAPRFEPGTFSVVVLLDVLEHVLDPKGVPRECARLLEPGGWLVLNTPNYAGSRHMWRRDRVLSQSREHLLHFTPESLRGLLRSQGWRRVALAGRPPLFPESLRAPDLPASRKAGKLLSWLYKRWVLHAVRPLRWENMVAFAQRPAVSRK